MHNFFKTKLFKIIFILTALLFGMITYEVTTNKPIFIEEVITTIARPCSNAVITIHKNILGAFDEFFNSGQYKEENEILKKEIAITRRKIAKFNEMKNENEQLKQALKIRDSNENFKVEIASFSAKNPDDHYGFTINIGRNKEVSEGDLVLTKNGLVGTIKDVLNSSSSVATILDMETQIPAIDSEKDEKGIIGGDAEFSKDGLCVMHHLNKSTSCEVGDLITTHGNSNYPENIPIGKIKEIRNGKNGMSCIAIIEPFENIFCVKDLVIIKRPK